LIALRSAQRSCFLCVVPQQMELLAHMPRNMRQGSEPVFLDRLTTCFAYVPGSDPVLQVRPADRSSGIAVAPCSCPFRKFHPAWDSHREVESSHDCGPMLAILQSLGLCILDLFKSRRRLEAENLFLRHQLSIALRRAPPRLRLRGSDRALLVWMTRLWPSLLCAAQVVQPETILRWHRAGFKAFWRWKSRNRAGRPKIDRCRRDLIRRMGKENPLWGAPRIHGELLKLGFEIAESTVSK
jgi:hypothetical protein